MSFSPHFTHRMSFLHFLAECPCSRQCYTSLVLAGMGLICFPPGKSNGRRRVWWCGVRVAPKADMIKVKIRANSVVTPKRIDLLNILSNHNVKCSKLQSVSDYFILWCSDDSDVDALFSPASISALNVISCVPQLPPDIRPKRTVLLRYVDELIFQEDNDNIIEELQLRNPWLVTPEIFAFPKSAIIKLTCSSIAVANKTKHSGVRLFRFFVPPSNIVFEDYINITMCYKCYSFEDHLASSCPKPSNYKICSLCSKTDHTYKQCSTQVKVCVNCGGSHSTLALSCPRRREIVKQKRLNTPRQSYAAVSKPSTPTVTKDILTNCNDIIAKSVMCMVVASMKNAETPGTFVDTMNHLLKANNLLSFSLGDITPPTMKTIYHSEQESQKPSPSGGNKENIHSTLSGKVTLYKKKSTPAVTPENIDTLYNAGHLLIDSDNAPSCIRQLALTSHEEFKAVVDVVDLNNKAFGQHANIVKVAQSKRTLRSNDGNINTDLYVVCTYLVV